MSGQPNISDDDPDRLIRAASDIFRQALALRGRAQAAERRAERMRKWIARAPHLDDCALQYGSSCSCGKTELTREQR